MYGSIKTCIFNNMIEVIQRVLHYFRITTKCIFIRVFSTFIKLVEMSEISRRVIIISKIKNEI